MRRVEDAAVRTCSERMRLRPRRPPLRHRPQCQEADPSAAEPVDWEAKLQAERERITKDNQRKIDERNDKLGRPVTRCAS